MVRSLPGCPAVGRTLIQCPIGQRHHAGNASRPGGRRHIELVGVDVQRLPARRPRRCTSIEIVALPGLTLKIALPLANRRALPSRVPAGRGGPEWLSGAVRLKDLAADRLAKSRPRPAWYQPNRSRRADRFCETDQSGSAGRRRSLRRSSMASMRSSLRSRWTS